MEDALIDDEHELARSAAAGSGDALAALLARYESRLTRFVGKRVRRREDAEDCLQEVRLRITRSIPGFRHREPFGPWAFAIAANVVKNHYRDAKATTSLPENLSGREPAADERLIRTEDAGRIRSAVAELPPRYRRVIEKRLRDGLPHRAVARAMGVSEGAARVLFCRALSALRKELGGADVAS